MTGGSENSSAWLELESDPGLFTLLVDDFGVKGVQVEEIYDLSKTLENSIFGFIFLFKWMERKGRRNKAATLDPNSNYVTDPHIVNKMFFAHQIVPNSCATHALLSILLNYQTNKHFDLGELLTKFQRVCDGLSPQSKGVAIGNQPKLAQAHNSYAKPENQSSTITNQINDSPYATSSSTPSSSSLSTLASSSFNYQSSYNTPTSNNDMANSSAEIFHFICFVPIEGRLYELDGLKPYPVDHGPLENDLTKSNCLQTPPNWTTKFKSIIRNRLSSFNSGQQNHEIRFNLMALVPDKMVQLGDQIELMKYNYTRINYMLTQAACMFLGNESGMNIKQELTSQITIKKEADLNENADSNESVVASTRQLRSSRASQNNISKDIANDMSNGTTNKNEQFELNFIDSNGNEIDDRKKNLTDLCQLYIIESIKYLTAPRQYDAIPTDSKEKENEIINKIKSRLNTIDCQQLKERFDNTKNEDSVLLKKFCDRVELKLLESKLFVEIETEESRYNEELDKRKKYKTDALRRKHAYDEFIVTYLKILNENGKLADLVRSNQCSILNNSGTSQNNSSLFLQQSTSKKRKK